MKDPTIQLWCEDEVHFQRHSSLIRMWAPKGQQPRVLSPSVRHKVGFFGALNLKTGCLLTKEAPTFNAETFGDFVRYLLQSTQGKLYLILDNASWHKARDLRDLFYTNRDRLVRIFLPPYSPELNLIEILWRKIKYEWMPFSAYTSFQSLQENLFDILANIGKTYTIKFA